MNLREVEKWIINKVNGSIKPISKTSIVNEYLKENESNISEQKVWDTIRMLTVYNKVKLNKDLELEKL